MTEKTNLATVAEAASVWRVSEPTVRRLCAEGQVRCVRIGECIRIPSDEIARVATQGTSRAA